MKKIWLLLVVVVFFTGCARQIKLDVSKISMIEYDGLKLITEDYNDINNLIKEVNFIETKYEAIYTHDFIVTTNEKLYAFRVSDDYRMQYTIDDQTYYSKDIDAIKKLLEHLKDLNITYNSDDFFQISDITQYTENSNDLFIKLDSTANYFTLTSELDLNNFKINRIEYVDEKFEDVDLLYKEDSISANKKIVIRTTYPDAIPNIRISFETKYGFVVSIIPTFLGKEGGFDYIITMDQK